MIRAISDRIVITPESIKDNVNGVFLPETSIKKPMKGIVTSIGEDVKEVKVGYEVIFLSGHGAQVDESIIIKEGDILGYYQNE